MEIVVSAIEGGRQQRMIGMCGDPLARIAIKMKEEEIRRKKHEMRVKHFGKFIYQYCISNM